MPEDNTWTPMQRLADYLVPGGIEAFVRTRRSVGTSWRRIMLDLIAATDGKIDVTIESLRKWFPDARPDESEPNGDSQVA